MNNIKLRAWHKELKQMYEVDGIDFSFNKADLGIGNKLESHSIIGVPADKIELMQWTGFQDKNGFDIYEGDIVRLVFGEKSYQEEVRWHKESASFRGFYPDTDFLEGEDCDLMDCLYEYQVIGNIYEHPELLEEYEQQAKLVGEY